MAASPNVQNSYGLEMTASEHMPHAPPQVHAAENPLYFVDNPDKVAPLDETTADGEKAPAKQILGLSPRIFWILAAVIVLLLGTGIGVGVGVGVTQANQAPDDPTTTDLSSESPSSTSTAPVTSGTVGVAANSCDFFEEKPYRAPDGTEFSQHCFTDWPLGDEAVEGDETVKDVGSVMSYTFEDCMGECLSHNGDLDDDDDDDTRCAGVSYIANLTYAIVERDLGANCFFKDRQGVDLSADRSTASANIVE